jgi:hypothetical protein
MDKDINIEVLQSKICKEYLSINNELNLYNEMFQAIKNNEVTICVCSSSIPQNIDMSYHTIYIKEDSMLNNYRHTYILDKNHINTNIPKKTSKIKFIQDYMIKKYGYKENSFAWVGSKCLSYQVVDYKTELKNKISELQQIVNQM